MLAGNLDPACFKETARACLALVLFLLLLNYIGSINMSGAGSLEHIRSNWMALGMRVKAVEAQVVFS